MFTNYLQYARHILNLTYGDKSTNTIRVLFALNSFPQGATYTQLLNYAPAFNQSALSRTLQTCLSKNYIRYNPNTRIYSTNYFYNITTLGTDKLKWVKKILASTLVGSNTTLIRISIFLIAVNSTDLNILANEIQSTEKNTENAILAITDALGTEIIIYDRATKQIEANLNWF